MSSVAIAFWIILAALMVAKVVSTMLLLQSGDLRRALDTPRGRRLYWIGKISPTAMGLCMIGAFVSDSAPFWIVALAVLWTAFFFWLTVVVVRHNARKRAAE